MLSKYQQARDVRREQRTLAGTFRGGKLNPIMAVPVTGSESGVVTQSVTYELDPIAGRMITPITAEIIAVFVPAPAIDALKNPEDDYPGNSEVVRQKLLSGNPLFALEEETEVSKRLGIVPRSVSGTKYVNEAGRLAHNCAVNHLRQRKYVKAELLDSTADVPTPAIISEAVLERLNGVLDPEDRVNGSVDLNLPSMNLPISGIGFTTGSTDNGARTVYDSAGTGSQTENYQHHEQDPGGVRIRADGSNEHRPDV